MNFSSTPTRGILCRCLALLSLLFAASSLSAQILEPDSLTIPLEIRGRFNAAPDEENGASVVVEFGSYLTNTSGDPGWVDFSTTGTAIVMPGKLGSASVTLDHVDSAIIQISAPPGNRVFINGLERSRIEVFGDGTHLLEIRVESDRGGAFGASGSFRAGPNHTIMAFGMGNLSNGRSAGVITLTEPEGSNNYYNPGSLTYENISPEVEKSGVAGVYQFYVYNGLVTASPVNNHAFTLSFFPRAQVGAKVSGLYTTTGSPLYSYLIENTGYPSNHNTVRLTKTINQGGATHEMWTQTSKSGNTYEVLDWVDKPSGATSITGVVTKKWTSSGSGSSFNDSSSVYPTGSPSTPATSETRYYATQSWGSSELTQRNTGSDTSTTFTYADKRVATETTTGGLWKKYEYYTDFDRHGQIYRTYKPYMNTPSAASGASTTSGELTTYDYEADWTGRKTLPGSVVTTINGTTTAKTEYTYNQSTTVTDVSRTYTGSNATMKLLVATRKDYYDATHYLTTVTTTYRGDADPQFFYYPGLPRSEKRPDGTMTMCLYYRGTFSKATREFTAAKDGPEIFKLTFQGTTATSSETAAMTSYTLGDQSPTIESGFRIVPGVSTAQGVVMSADGTLICTMSLICTGTTSSPAWQVVQRDVNSYAEGVLLSSTMRDSGNAAAVWSIFAHTITKGRIDSTVDENGVRTDFTYDTSGRVLTKKRQSGIALGANVPELTTTFEYDAAGRTTKETVSGNGTSETLVTLRTYDTAGRVVSETKPGYATAGSSTASAVVTSFAYDPTNRKVTATLPSGSTKIETKFQDGRVASTTGTGVVNEYFTYGVETDGRRYTRVNVATSTDSRKNESWDDMLGRPVKTSRPSFTGVSPSTFDETKIYDDYTGTNTGRLIKTTKTGFAPTLLQYNAMSQVVRSGIDLDSTSGLTLASSYDRVSDTSELFESYDGAWWVTKIESSYPNTGGSASTPVVMATTRKRLTGLTDTLRGEVRSLDTYGNETRVKTEATVLSKLVVTTTKRPGMANDQVETALNGLTIQVLGHDQLTTKKRYDALARPVAEIQPRTGTELNPTVRTIYHPNTTWPKEMKDASSKRTSFTHYDGAGRAIYTQDANGGTTRTTYTARGEVEYVWGSATYPVSYAYSSYGEKTTLRTYRQSSYFDADSTTWPGSGATADETTWEFDGPSGLLKKKTDAAGKYVEYTYNARGQTATRKWARILTGTTRVTTTYAYYGDGSGEPQTGELKSTSYNDSTPTVTNTYTRAGQPDTIIDVTGTRDLVYNSTYPGQLDAEGLDTFYGSRLLTRTYDTSTSTNTGTSYNGHTIAAVFGRVHGLKLGTSSTPAGELEFAYEVSNVGRFAGIISKRDNGASSRKFIYGYETDSALLKTLAIDGSHPFAITRTFEPYRDLLADVETKWSTTSRTKFAYAYDDLRRRQSLVQSGDVFSDYGGADNGAIHLIFEYNARSEVTKAATFLGATATDQSTPLSARRHEFAYDAIGNRKSSNTSGVPALADQYTANALNQYTGRENNTVAATGVADTAANVVAGPDAVARAGRAGKHWGDNTLVPNASGPYQGPLKIFAAKPGAGSGGADLLRTDTRTAFVPPAWQTMSYDDDGNILDDGVWVYTWDAENRLVAMETKPSAIGAGITAVDARRLEFKYDFQHRRVEKKVYSGWNGSTYATTLSLNRYLYDGWSLIADYSVSGGTLSLVRSYTWGLDIARSMSDAGGVGALLQITDHASAKTFLPAYDGNGNVVALLNSSTGVVAAAYEYSPYGEFLRCESPDSAVIDQPFRFSTKFYEGDTGLYYYGRRFMNPTQGRFLGRDTLQEAGGRNLYGFCRNNAVNLWDVLGMYGMGDVGSYWDGGVLRWRGFDQDGGWNDSMTLEEAVGAGFANARGKGRFTDTEGQFNDIDDDHDLADQAAAFEQRLDAEFIQDALSNGSSVVIDDDMGGTAMTILPSGEIVMGGISASAAGGNMGYVQIGPFTTVELDVMGEATQYRAPRGYSAADIAQTQALSAQWAALNQRSGNAFWESLQPGFAQVSSALYTGARVGEAVPWVAAAWVVAAEAGPAVAWRLWRSSQCFSAGTMIATPSGDVRIEDIKVGDAVFAFDFEGKQTVIRKVTEVVNNFTYCWVDVHIGDEVIHATRSHPFWVEDKGLWIKAVDLKSGMLIRSIDGTCRVISEVDVREISQPETTYNFEVEVDHNYFVGANKALVHNPDGRAPVPVPSGRPPAPVPGGGTWVQQGPMRDGVRTWIPQTPVNSPAGSQPQISWDTSGHWDLDHGNGTRTRYDFRGNPISSDQAHNPNRPPTPRNNPRGCG